MLEFYGVMIALTAVFLWQNVKPRSEIEWLALVGLSALWPLCVAIAAREMWRMR